MTEDTTDTLYVYTDGQRFDFNGASAYKINDDGTLSIFDESGKEDATFAAHVWVLATWREQDK